MMNQLTTMEKNALNDFRNALVGDFGAIDVRLFGSRARGEGDEESDLDVFIVLPEISWKVCTEIYGFAFAVWLKP